MGALNHESNRSDRRNWVRQNNSFRLVWRIMNVVVDADVVSRQLTAVNGGAMPEIIKQFGPEAASPDSSMNRRFIRELVFSDPEAKTVLENILHPLIRKECQRQLDASQSPYTILSVPLLIESPFWRSSINRLLVVEAPEALRIERVIQRSKLTPEGVKKIISTQATNRAKTRCCR